MESGFGVRISEGVLRGVFKSSNHNNFGEKNVDKGKRRKLIWLSMLLIWHLV